VRGVNADLLPEGMFIRSFTFNAVMAAVPIQMTYPHYKGTPARFLRARMSSCSVRGTVRRTFNPLLAVQTSPSRIDQDRFSFRS